MSKQAQISVVVPCYQCAKTIEQTIASIAAQTCLPSEVILVDDCSGDDTLQKLTHVKNSYPDGWIKVLSLITNSGPGAARNAGWKSATQPYISFLDADDVWLPVYIEEILCLIKDYPDAGFFSTYHLIKIGNDYYKPKTNIEETFKGKLDDFFLSFSCGFSTINSSTACVKKECLDKIGGFPEDIRVNEDLILWFKLALEFKFAYTGRACAVYYRDVDNYHKRKVSYPKSLDFLSSLSLKSNKSICLLFKKIAFVNAARMIECGDANSLFLIEKELLKNRMLFLYIKILSLKFLPYSFFLSCIRCFRFFSLKKVAA